MSGPVASVASSVTVKSSLTVVATLPYSEWNDNLGNLIEFTGEYTPPAASGQVLTVQLRQGATASGAQVGHTVTEAFVSSVPGIVAIAAYDASAFALSGAGQYCVVAKYAVHTTGTLSGVATLQTCAPVA